MSLILFEPFQAEIAAHLREHCQLGRVVEHRRESVFFMERSSIARRELKVRVHIGWTFTVPTAYAGTQ